MGFDRERWGDEGKDIFCDVEIREISRYELEG
jgi:hypothetical protein